MSVKPDFDRIQLEFQEKLMVVDLSDSFYKLNDHQIGFKCRKYRKLGVKNSVVSEFDEFRKCIIEAVKVSEEVAIQFFKDQSEELEPVYPN